MKPYKPFTISQTKLDSMKRVSELFAKEDGIQRGAFFDTSGKLRTERVYSSMQVNWLYKTEHGKPLEHN